MLIFMLCFLSLYSNPVVLYVHLGKNWVEYLNTSINQVKKFNPDIDIYLISDKDNFLKVTNKDVKLIDYEKLNKSPEHIQFIENHGLSSGFWQFASERFFYIQNFILDTKLKNIIHLESDIMVFCNLKEQFNKFSQLAKNENIIGATFDSDNRCIPGIVFIKGSMTNLLNTFNIELKNKLNDMQAISQFRKNYPGNCLSLPIITPEYHYEYGLRNLQNEIPEDPAIYFEYSNHFDAIFDAASLGQFLGGIDPIHLNNGSGFINETCIFDPSLLSINWELNDNNFYLPYIKYKNKKYKINNLHIHCKRLNDFTDKAIELEIYKIKTNLKNDLDEKIKNMNANIDSLISSFEKKELHNLDAIKYLKYLKLTN
jgi:hypothetical protein